MSDFAEETVSWIDLNEMAEAQVKATLALANQQRIANLIALAGLQMPDGSRPFTELVADFLGPYTVQLKPEIEKSLSPSARLEVVPDAY